MAHALDPPSQFLCPISRDIMIDPVICADGHTYERQQITHWFEGHHTSPYTNANMVNKTLIPNISLRNLIREWQDNPVNIPDAPVAGAARVNVPPPPPPPAPGLNHFYAAGRRFINWLGIERNALFRCIISALTRLQLDSLTQKLNIYMPRSDSRQFKLVLFMLVTVFVSCTLGHLRTAIACLLFLCLEWGFDHSAAIGVDFSTASLPTQSVTVAIGIGLLGVLLVLPMYARFALLGPSIGLSALVQMFPQHTNHIRHYAFYAILLFVYFPFVMVTVGECASLPRQCFLSILNGRPILPLLSLVFAYETMYRSSSSFDAREIALYGSCSYLAFGVRLASFWEFRLSWFLTAWNLMSHVSQWNRVQNEWNRVFLLQYAIYVRIACACLWPDWTLSQRFNSIMVMLMLFAERIQRRTVARNAVLFATVVLAFLFPSVQYEDSHYMLRGLHSLYDMTKLLCVKLIMTEVVPFVGTTKVFNDFANHISTIGDDPPILEYGREKYYALLYDNASASSSRLLGLQSFDGVAVLASVQSETDQSYVCTVRRSLSQVTYEVPLANIRRLDDFEFTSNHAD